MSNKGIIVDHRESKVRYAISPKNFNEKIHKFVRDLLLPGETVLGYQPHPIKRLGQKETTDTKPEQATEPVDETEGSAPADTEGQ